MREFASVSKEMDIIGIAVGYYILVIVISRGTIEEQNNFKQTTILLRNKNLDLIEQRIITFSV